MRKMCVLFTVVLGLALLPASASALNFKPAAGSPITNASPDDAITAITTGNFNSDIYDDVAELTKTNKLYIWLTQADGSFQAAPGSPYSLTVDGTEKYSMWADEMTGDFRDDLIIQSSQFPGTFYTFLNSGTGAFPSSPASTWAVDHTGPPNFRGATSGTPTTLADLTGDGCKDLLVGMYETSFQVGISNCAGVFTRATSAPVHVTTPLSGSFDGFTATAAGDYNGDGDADIALMLKASGFSAGPRMVYVMNGNDTGLFGTAVAYYDVPGLENSSLTDIETIDQNGDQYDDLLVLRREANSSDSITNLLGGASGLVANPAGSLTEAYRGAYTLAAADFDGDGFQDVGATLRGNSQIKVAFSDGVDSFTWNGPWDLPPLGGNGFFPNDFETPDLNGDGFPDIVTSSTHTTAPTQARGIHALISRPAVNADKIALSFPETAVGQSSPEQTVTLSVDTGPTASFVNADFSIQGTGDVNYDLDTDCPGTVAAGETCDVNVTFAPGVEGEHDPDLRIKTPDGDTIVIPISGVTGHEAMNLASPDGTDWVTPFGYSMSKTFRIESTGTWPTTVDDIAIFPEDEEDESLWILSDFNNCGKVLQPGEDCEFEVYFEPTEFGDFEADVVAFNEDMDLTDYATVTGFGTESEFNYDQGSLAFDSRELGSGPSAAQTFKVTSVGNGPVPFGAVEITGPDASSFKVAGTGPCPALLPMDETCSFTVIFEPQGAAGDKNAKIEFDAYRNVNPEVTKEITLSGSATDPPLPPPPSPDADPRLTVKSVKKIKAGKKLLVSATVRNAGDAASLNPITLKATSPKKTTRPVKAIKIASLNIGQTVVRKFRIPVKKNAKGKFRVKVALAYDGHTSVRKSAQTAPVKIQKRRR